MRAGPSVQSRLIAAALTACVAASAPAPPQLAAGGGSGPAATTLRSAEQGGSTFSPGVGTRAPVNVRTLAARGPTETPIAPAIPLRTRTVPEQPDLSTPSAQVYGGPVPVQASITSNPAAAQPGFQGLAYATGAANAVHPPDPWVAVGPDHVVQAVNRSLRITNRSGGSATFVSLADFFGTSGLSVTTSNADPRVIFDSLHGRWVATELSWDCAPGAGAAHGHGYVDVRISNTSDPSGTWSGFYVYFNDMLPDYPALGTSSDKVGLTSNMFVMLGGAGNCAAAPNVGYAGIDVIVMDWAAILNVTTLPLDEYVASFDYFTPRVAVQTPATSAALRMIIQKDVGGGILDVAYVTISGLVGAGGGTAATEVDLTSANIIQDFKDPIPPRQPAGDVTTAIDSRPTDANWQNNELTFVSTQACTPTGDSVPRDCVRVSQLNTSTATPSLVQDFLIAQTGADSYLGGIGRSGNGGLFVAWTRSSATASAYPSSYGAYQLPADAPNSISPPELLAAGQADYTGNRWGDYVGVAQDPQDRNAVWQGNEYASSDGKWGTLVSQIKTVADSATFVPLSPARLLDTRVGNGLSGPFNALVPRTFQVTGLGGVPATATAVTGNLTATGQTQAGFVFLGPDPVANPTSSTLNFPLGDTRANGVTVALSLSGSLSATFAYAGTTHLIFDVTGYFVE